MSILITGGAGYIGSHFAFALQDAGEKFCIVDNLSTGARALVPAGTAFLEGNCGDRVRVETFLKQNRVDTVVHFAASAIVPDSVADPLSYYRNNVVATVALLEACVAAGMKQFIFSSTAATYGSVGAEPVREDAPLNPISPYGASKVMCEQILRDTAAATGMRYVALRYFNVAGADEKGRTGQSTPRATHLVKAACRVALGLQRELEIFGTDYPTPDGTCVRDYIHVSDLADVHVLAMRHLAKGGASGIYNCGYGHGYSVREVIAAVEAEIGKKIPVKMAPRRPGDAVSVVADASKIKRELGWKPTRDDLRLIVRTALAWERRLVRQEKAL